MSDKVDRANALIRLRRKWYKQWGDEQIQRANAKSSWASLWLKVSGERAVDEMLRGSRG